ncbi:cell wall metabolism sensor histidine kinase WalK [Plantactinospora sp. KBS50]|uniref:sensor histidine kinase n=1 Tax=Plantactinospora sp. KBS50 TaxID=2024580 RepID=UPI000BAB1909|nr:ATP-binding protein [Plantactinospora sp. KBS50]ASW56895.1 two-component sensor histidine kinase [Plantactinospora sp. KBS50]
MYWYVVAALAVGLALGLAAGPTLARVRRSAAAGRGGGPGGRPGTRIDGGTAIEQDQPSGLPSLGRRTVDSLRVGVVVLGPDELPVLINPAARAMGLLRAGPEAGSVVPHPIIRTLAGQVRRTGVRREVELDLPRGRGGSGSDPLGVHLRAMGVGEGYVAVEAADVTEAHRVARVRRDFVANVSHELKTPIGALQLLAEALLDATDPSDHRDPEAAAEDVAAARRFAERISSESTRLGRLVNELLELTRLQGAEPLPAPEPVSVDWILAEVVDRTRTTAAARRIEISVEGLRGQTVYGSDSQLATAVTNLVENAIAYSGEDTRVTIAVTAGEDRVEIAVADHGIGIAPDDVNRIFERFYRADQARSRSTGGTGLGLAIVKHIATNHGGRVQVTSTLGGGSTFTLWLPASPPDAFLPPPPSAEIESGSAALR